MSVAVVIKLFLIRRHIVHLKQKKYSICYVCLWKIFLIAPLTITFNRKSINNFEILIFTAAESSSLLKANNVEFFFIEFGHTLWKLARINKSHVLDNPTEPLFRSRNIRGSSRTCVYFIKSLRTSRRVVSDLNRGPVSTYPCNCSFSWSSFKIKLYIILLPKVKYLFWQHRW